MGTGICRTRTDQAALTFFSSARWNSLSREVPFSESPPTMHHFGSIRGWGRENRSRRSWGCAAATITNPGES